MVMLNILKAFSVANRAHDPVQTTIVAESQDSEE
jgi:hypothetical protein